jgi:hypothetical protein
MASLLGGTDLGVSRLQKRKAGTGMPGETPSLSPCATRVLFSTCGTITQPFGWKEFFNSVSDAFQHRVFQHSET